MREHFCKFNEIKLTCGKHQVSNSSRTGSNIPQQGAGVHGYDNILIDMQVSNEPAQNIVDLSILQIFRLFSLPTALLSERDTCQNLLPT